MLYTLSHVRLRTCLQALALLIFLLPSRLSAQSEAPLISGPMLGYSEHRSVLIWFEVSQSVKSAMLRYWESTNTEYFYEMDYTGPLQQPYNPIRFELVNLKLNTAYNYELLLNGKEVPIQGKYTFTTKPHQANPEAEPYSFSFLAGSCAYLNDPQLDASTSPYGQDPYIFRTMASMKTDFMLWMGDNLYLRPSDYGSAAGMYYRYSLQRKSPELAELLRSRPNYAIWDDHDYGENDADRSFELKPVAQQLFRDYWGNKSYGADGDQGIYGSYSWSDCDFFLTDDRSHRAPNRLMDSIGGKPNCDKTFLGAQQLNWLKDKLISSTATFKFIVAGNQVLNPLNENEAMRHYPCEFNELINFIVSNRIEGVVFLSGDRHYSEVIGFQPKGCYTLYDITCSPISSSPREPAGKEKDNPARVPQTLVTINNYGRFEVSGARGDRALKMVTVDRAGVVQSTFLLNEKDLKMK